MIINNVRLVLENEVVNGSVEVRQLQQVIRRTVGRWLSTRLRRKPMIIPVVVVA